MPTTYVIGDLHGHLEKLISLLQRASLIDDKANWCADDAHVWFVGDFFDRGPDGIGCVDLAMKLQKQAVAEGGHVQSLIGNHDVLVMSIDRFRNNRTSQLAGLFLDVWVRNGGRQSDLERLTARHVDWLTNLPAMALVGDRLLVHADAFMLYTGYGRTVDAVNLAFRRVLQSNDENEWERMITEFSERLAFLDNVDMGINGAQTAAHFMRLFGGLQLIHGHTPISKVVSHPPELVDKPLVYANGLCINVDGGIYMGGPGFAYRLPSWLESLSGAGKKVSKR